MDNRDPRTHAIIGAAMEVHRHLGHGFLEGIYQEALGIELRLCGIPFHAQADLPITYKGQSLAITYRSDFICHGSLIVEIKAVSQILPIHEAQVINYLKATGFPIGLLINFGAPRLGFRRFIRSTSPCEPTDETQAGLSADDTGDADVRSI